MEEVVKSGFTGEKLHIIPRNLLDSFSKNCSHLYLTDIGYFPLALFHKRKRKNGCPQYILMYCVEGKGKIIVENTEHQLYPNTFYIIKSNTPHTYLADREDPWSIYWVHFDGTCAPHVHSRFENINQKRPVLIPFEQSRIDEFNYTIDLLNLGISSDSFEYSSMLLHKLLGSFLFYTVVSKTKATQNDELVNSIISFLKSKTRETVTIEMVSKEFLKSPTSIFTMFKKKTGYSVIHYANLLKIQSACEMFSLTDMSVKEVSYHLNFQDPLYFSRLFKKYMGISPKEYCKHK